MQCVQKWAFVDDKLWLMVKRHCHYDEQKLEAGFIVES